MKLAQKTFITLLLLTLAINLVSCSRVTNDTPTILTVNDLDTIVNTASTDTIPDSNKAKTNTKTTSCDTHKETLKEYNARYELLLAKYPESGEYYIDHSLLDCAIIVCDVSGQPIDASYSKYHVGMKHLTKVELKRAAKEQKRKDYYNNNWR